MSLPDRRSFPDYYRLIKHPLTLLDIENRMIARRFETADHFFDEIDKLCANAEAYNQDHSEIWIDAQQIRGIVSQHRDLAKERIAAPRNSQGKPLNPPSATSTPIRHPGMMVPQGPGGAAPPLAPHQMMLPPDIRAAYAQQVNYAYGTPPGRSQQLPMVSPQAQVQQLPQAAYLPALPHGMVTEETVASLERYPPFQQQAWLNSLPPLAKTAYHQITAINEARKRGVAPPPPPEPVAVPEPATPRDPTIKHIDFTCNASTLRLENVRGILTHAVAVAAGNAGADLRLELTAWIDTSAEPAASPRKQPDLALKVNGAPSAAAMTKVLGGGKDAPTGVRWTVPVSGNDAKIELVATRPGALIETSAIFVNRQY
jgi:hypothetical protein